MVENSISVLRLTTLVLELLKNDSMDFLCKFQFDTNYITYIVNFSGKPYLFTMLGHFMRAIVVVI